MEAKRRCGSSAPVMYAIRTARNAKKNVYTNTNNMSIDENAVFSPSERKTPPFLCRNSKTDAWASRRKKPMTAALTITTR